MIIQDNDFLLSDAEFFELGQHIRPERSRLALLPGEEAQAPSRVVEEYEELPGDKRQALTAIVSGLAYPVRFMRLHYSMADENISRQLIVWPKSGDEVVTLARNGRLWRASTNTEFGVRSLIKEVLGAGSNLRREPFTLTLSSTATLVFLGILEQMHFAHLYAILMNQAPDGTFKAEDVLERMRQSSKEDFRWPLAMFEKVLPVRPFETVQLEDVTGGLAELVERELVESIDENGRLYELTPEGGLVADSVVHEVSKAALCVTQCRPDGVIGHDAVLLVRGSFYLFLFEITGEEGVLASVNEEAADVFLARTMQAPDAEVISAAALAASLPEPAPGVETSQPVMQPEGLAGEATTLKARQWMLDIQSGPLKGQRIPLGECLKIGRAGENDLVLADTQVSRKHAIIQKVGVGYHVTDLRSGNGTLVNEVLITKPTGLKPGDVVQIGETRMTILSPAGTAPLPLEELTQVEEAADQPAVWRCPHCGATLKPAARFCGSCGKPVLAEEAAPQATTPAAPAVAPARVCPKCGEPARAGVNFCKKCGTRL